MMKLGQAPYLECSTRGDRRLSAFVATPQSLGGKTIEVAYQAMKILEDGRTGLWWKEAKGKRAVNQAECSKAYDLWWLEWVRQENLLPILQAARGLSDMFGKAGSVCQAEVLWRIRNGELK